jgi:2-C-methyl-D-erythritol 4-phosphate cytidylyltransferase
MGKSVVLVAGGAGVRMGSDLPKQFLSLCGKPVFIHSINAFLKAFEEINIVLVLPSKYIDYAQKLILDHKISAKSIQFVSGGNTRFESVKNGLEVVPDDHVVFVHDAVRCLISVDLIRSCDETCLKYGSAIPVLPLRDSIREILSDGTSRSLDRSLFRIIQTPQTFIAKYIKAAYGKPYQESFTDEATVAESSGLKVYLIEGEQSNIKLTYSEDIDYANWKLSAS